jgi:Ca2+/H+ antiporter, TMEM165/GDT1 family
MAVFVDLHHLLEGFLKSWGMILVSEIGDKTFFIAAIMAMRNPRRTARARFPR